MKICEKLNKITKTWKICTFKTKNFIKYREKLGFSNLLEKLKKIY
jgi:hypothetical protein